MTCGVLGSSSVDITRARSSTAANITMSIERIKIDSKDQWLTLRKFDLTASVLGAIDGHDPYISPLRLYIEKRGIELPNKQSDSPVLRRGRLFENAVAAAVSEMR